MKKGIKLRYRIPILIAIFICALIYFGQNYLEVKSFDFTVDTVETAEPSLPKISFLTGGEEVNLLYGYTSNLDMMLIRETITPLEKDKTINVLIDENLCVVRRLKYELFDVGGSDTVLETATINALTENDTDQRKSAKIKLKLDMTEGKEYGLKITLVTSTSKRVYYYTRVKMYQTGYLQEKLQYVNWFRESALTKQNEEAVKKNLETVSSADTSTFSRVTINSNWSMVSWGSLQPTIVCEEPPKITDYYGGTAAIVLSYIVSIPTDSGLEYYTVSEKFRFLYTEIRTYLYNYERNMESIFDSTLTSLAKDDLKLGITANPYSDLVVTSDYTYTAFDHSGEIWLYDRKENELTEVFSFRTAREGNSYDFENSHSVDILNVDSEGNVDFLVYGYMLRGGYEGRVGVILYHFNKNDQRIEELLYIPVNTTYQLLLNEMSDCVYLNRYDILYFSLFDTIYSYNLTTKKLDVVAADVPPEHLVMFRGQSRLIWQRESEDSLSKELVLINLESGEQTTIPAAKDEVLLLLGKLDENLVYGIARDSDIVKNYDGTNLVPMYRVVIADLEGNVKKEYQSEGFFVTDASFEQDVMILHRVRRSDSILLSYEPADSDAILNRSLTTKESVNVVSRVTDLTLTEYYISFPGNVAIDELPKEKSTVNTVLTSDTTVRITESASRPARYFTYSYGEVRLATRFAGDAIRLANEDENVGAVIDGLGRLVWERGVKSNRSSISEIVPVSDRSLTTLQAALKMLFLYNSQNVDVSEIRSGGPSVLDVMNQYLRETPVNLKGCSLDEVLYYVYKKKPVVAITGTEEALLIVGYDSNNIEVVDVSVGKIRKVTKEAAEALFHESGDLFFSYYS